MGMGWLYIVLFSFVQGATEFIPVSSSAHLLVLPYILGVRDQGIVADIAAHVGSFAAVLVVFRKEVLGMAAALLAWKKSPARELALKIAVATVPLAMVAGPIFFLKADLFRNPIVPIFTLAIFGALLWFADARFHGTKDERGLSFKDAFLIGCGQALAVLPGVSRSGICLTVGLALGLKREEAVRFAFLLLIPTAALAGAGAAFEYSRVPSAAFFGDIASTAALSFLFSVLAIRLMLAWAARFSLKAFAVYRIAFAALLALLLL
jgi:undecaprenyl-diphosphatase